ncbi:hypothetical protein DEIPH_ctg081orf0007 [Deinococcus phoenicis]|uniref:Uncharacterized protein n=1 Tax=Deinococcus phoenicis TaxID=1476583 RepID=A0A016QKF9_9DEIO|nr:hypothetical protein [Deinococcus phoenicis]EYB66620.1 hypothetical protein DEIPH_ctg081orf0007 [Deinococcus phoenicis]
MPLRPAALLCLLLLGAPALFPAFAATPTSTAAPWNSLPVTPEDEDAALALKAPAFAGLWVEGQGVVLMVTSTDPAARQAVLSEVRRRRGHDLTLSGHDLTRVRFVPARYNAAQLSRARYLARGLFGWNSIGVDVRANRLRIEFQTPEARNQAAAFFKGRGVPADALQLVALPSPGLPARTTFPHPLKARLVIPRQVAQGDLLTLQFPVMNTGKEAFSFNRVCSFDFMVVRADTGKVVRPVPAPPACPSIAGGLIIQPGETRDALTPVWQSVAPAHWDLRDARGQFVPPGNYLLKAAHGSGAFAIRPPDVPFTVLPPAKDGGVLKPLQILAPAPTVQSIKGTARFEEQGGVQRLVITVPDERAKQAVQDLARKKGVSLARVTIQVTPPAPLPPSGKPGEAELKVGAWTSPQGTLHDISLKLLNPAARRTLPGARECLFVAVVRKVDRGEVVYSTRTFPNSRANHCPTGASLHRSLDARWDGRLSSGKLAPAGRYEVRAGVRVTQPSGKVAWLSAPAQPLNRNGGKGECQPIFCDPEEE